MLGQRYPALVISLAVHLVLMGIAAAFKMASTARPDQVLVETIFEEERVQEQFTQEMDVDTSVSQLLSVTSGGVVSENLGATASVPVAQHKVEQTQTVQDPKVRVPNIGDIDVPGLAALGTDLGEGEVSGEVGARVEGYGAAMHRLTQEIIRMMRDQPVIAVWLFDGSNSLKDDRIEIAENFNKIYEELDLARAQAEQKNERYAALETMICSFGSDVKKLTPNPTSDLKEITDAIGKIQDDPTGVENFFGAVSTVIDEYGVPSQRSRRKLAIIVVADESGDDEQNLEDVVAKADKYKAPVYVLGREAIFGYKLARVLWIDEETGLPFWPTISRGPETAYPECLQYEGFHDRSWEATSSGFGPYAQTRLVKESGGIYFMLARDEEQLAGWGARTPRKFDDIAMKEYEPLLEERREYARIRDTSEFRRTLYEVISVLDPQNDSQLYLQRDNYPMDNEEFKTAGQRTFERALRSRQILGEAIARMERIKPERDREPSERWRAAYDLAYAQCLSYYVRQFQLLLAIDNHGKEPPMPKDPKSNYWDVREVPQLVEPNEQQIKATKVDLAVIEEYKQKALAAYQRVVDDHPSTPWELRARQEMNWGFGVTFVEDYWDPRYNDPEVQARVPKF